MSIESKEKLKELRANFNEAKKDLDLHKKKISEIRDRLKNAKEKK